jgi:hypothetical protein
MDVSYLWWVQPPHAKLLFEFLAVVSLIAMVCVGMLGWTLLALPGRRRISIDDVIAHHVDADRLAKSALAGVIRRDCPRGSTSAGSQDELGRLMRSADARFAYGWHRAQARVTTTKGLASLTVLASATVVGLGAYPTLTLALYETNLLVHRALLEGLNQLMTRLAIGFAVSLVVGAVGLFFEGCLIRRKASWRLFQAMVADASPTARK